MATATAQQTGMNASDSPTAIRGAEILIGSQDVVLDTVVCYSTTAATRLRVTTAANGGGSLLGTYTLSGTPKTATGIALALTANTTYYLCCDNSGAGYLNHYGVGGQPQFPYASSPAGVFSVTGNAEDGSTGAVECIDTITVTYTPIPVAAFSGTPLSGFSPLSVAFTDASTNSPTSWLWQKDSGSGYVNFSSGHTSQNPTESFATGTWDIKLTATNAGGSDPEEKLDYIVATAPPPVAAFSGTPLTGTSSVTTVFTDSSTNTPTSWKWYKKINGGSYELFSTAQNPSQTFSEGMWSIKLTSTNASGSDDEEKLSYIGVAPFFKTTNSTGGPQSKAITNDDKYTLTLPDSGVKDYISKEYQYVKSPRSY